MFQKLKTTMIKSVLGPEVRQKLYRILDTKKPDKKSGFFITIQFN